MSKHLLHQLIVWPKSFITGTDLRIIIPGTDNARKSIVKRAAQAGYLENLKRDLYLIRNIPNKLKIDVFELAQFIYGPSYISFESALSYYGWIPESVPVTSSATIKQTRSFTTNVGTFSFEKVPNKIFSTGVTGIENDEAKFLMADPWKAITDIIYFRKKTWNNVQQLMQDLRIEPESILTSNLELLAVLAQDYPHKHVRDSARNILKSIYSLKGEKL